MMPRKFLVSTGDIRDDLKKQILMNHTGSRASYNQIPMVHGRSVGSRLDAVSSTTMNGTGNGANAANGGRSVGGRPQTKTGRLASHQRNLSLDFRSMGIVLPPVSQVTNTRVNLTQHHRNRSLDSALQGIPEVSGGGAESGGAGGGVSYQCRYKLRRRRRVHRKQIDRVGKLPRDRP